MNRVACMLWLEEIQGTYRVAFASMVVETSFDNVQQRYSSYLHCRALHSSTGKLPL